MRIRTTVLLAILLMLTAVNSRKFYGRKVARAVHSPEASTMRQGQLFPMPL